MHILQQQDVQGAYAMMSTFVILEEVPEPYLVAVPKKSEGKYE